MGTQVGWPLPDVRQASTVVVAVTSGRRGDKGGRSNDIKLRPRGTRETGVERGGGEREQTKWERVVELVHTAFWDFVLVEEAT